MAEIYFNEPGRRLFDMTIESKLFQNIDPFVIGGGKNRAFTLTSASLVDDGFVSIKLTPKINNAKISGIEIIMLEIHTAHAVAQGPYSVVDNDNDGFGIVTVDASPSHTHGPGLELTSHIWREGSTILGSGTTANLNLTLGEHTVALTVTDSGQNSNTELTTMTVFPFGSPDVVSLSPSTGGTFGGYEVNINGFGFSSAADLIVNFGLIKISGNAITVVNENTIKVTAPRMSVAVPVKVSVENIALGLTSNYRLFTYETPIAIKWKSKQITTLTSVSVASYGPDGNLYVGSTKGQLAKIILDDDFNIVSSVITSATPFRAILGMAFDPLDAGLVNPPVYFTSSYLFHGESNSSSGNAINGKVHRASGANLDFIETIVSGLPVADLDHAVNAIEFGDQGEIYIQIGSNTNGGIPGPLTGKQIQKENYFSAATVVAYAADPDFEGDIVYSAPDDGIPTTKGVEVFASGERNPFGITLHSNGKLYGTENGPNLGYGPMQMGCNGEFIPDVHAIDKSK